jgi:hypothetical protein
MKKELIREREQPAEDGSEDGSKPRKIRWDASIIHRMTKNMSNPQIASVYYLTRSIGNPTQVMPLGRVVCSFG